MRDDNNVINNIQCVAMLTIALFIKKKIHINKYNKIIIIFVVIELMYVILLIYLNI